MLFALIVSLLMQGVNVCNRTVFSGAKCFVLSPFFELFMVFKRHTLQRKFKVCIVMPGTGIRDLRRKSKSLKVVFDVSSLWLEFAIFLNSLLLSQRYM